MRLLAYLRFSPRPVVRWTIEKQKTDILRWAAANGHTIVGWFEDNFVSGDDNAGKVAQAALLTALREHSADGLVFADLSRWTRDEAIPALYFIDQLEKEGIRLFSTAEEFVNSPSKVRSLALLLVLSQNEEELRKIRENTSKGAYLAIENGVWYGPVPRYWRRVRYLADERDRGRVEGRSYWIECVDPAAVKTVFEGRRSGKSLGTLAAEMGITRSQINCVLSLKVNKEIVGGDLWDAVQGIKATQRHSMAYRSFLLTGLLLCPSCGHRLQGCQSVRLSADGTITYRCSYDGIPHTWRRIHQDRILRPLLAFFDRLDLDEETRAAIDETLNKPLTAARVTERQRLLSEIARQRNLMLAHRKRKDFPEHMIAWNLTELARAERRIPPDDPAPTAAIPRQIDVLCSVGQTIRQLKRYDNFSAVQAANAVLRDVVESITFVNGNRNQPVFYLKPEMEVLYDHLRSVYPIPATADVPIADDVEVDKTVESIRAAKKEYFRTWRKSEKGRASLKAANARYHAKLRERRLARREGPAGGSAGP